MLVPVSTQYVNSITPPNQVEEPFIFHGELHPSFVFDDVSHGSLINKCHIRQPGPVSDEVYPVFNIAVIGVAGQFIGGFGSHQQYICKPDNTVVYPCVLRFVVRCSLSCSQVIAVLVVYFFIPVKGIGKVR